MTGKISDHSCGFTLVEVIATLAIFGIVSTLVLSNYASSNNYNLISEAYILKTNLRYAQARAMSDTVNWGIEFANDGASYKLLRNNADFNLPTDGAATHVLQTGITVINGRGTQISFSDDGSPGPTQIELALSDGANRENLTVTKNTGYIP